METSTGSELVRQIRPLTHILYLMGLWPAPQATPPPTPTLLYTLYTICFQVTFTFAYVLFKCINFLHITDLTIITRAMFITLTELSLAVKIINFYFRQRTLSDCLRCVEQIQLNDESERSIFVGRLAFLRRIFWAFLVTANTTGVFSYLSPVLVTDGEPMLPYPGWYPLDWMHSRRAYWMVYGYQVVGMFCQIQALVIIEVYFIYLMVVVSAQVEVLARRLERIGYEREEEQQDDGNAADKNDEKAKRSLKECVRVHRKVLRLASTIQATGSIPYFIQFLLSCIILCVAVFQIAIMNPRESMAEFVFYVGFVATMLTQIFLPCYFGNEIRLKSEQLFGALYESKWTGGRSRSYRRSVLLCMELMRRPRRLVVGQLISLTLDSFLSVLNKAYSLYAVLQSFTE